MKISFCANKVTDTHIQRLNNLEQKTYEEFKVPIVEYDRFSGLDKKSIEQTAALYSEYDHLHANYAQNINFKFEKVYENPHNLKSMKYHAILIPQDSYNWVDPKNVLGIIETSFMKDSPPKIDYLQVNPHTNYWFGDIWTPRGYKQIGTALVKFVTDRLFAGHDVYVNSDYNSMDFYIKLGFEKLEGTLLKYCPKK